MLWAQHSGMDKYRKITKPVTCAAAGIYLSIGRKCCFIHSLHDIAQEAHTAFRQWLRGWVPCCNDWLCYMFDPVPGGCSQSGSQVPVGWWILLDRRWSWGVVWDEKLTTTSSLSTTTTTISTKHVNDFIQTILGEKRRHQHLCETLAD